MEKYIHDRWFIISSFFFSILGIVVLIVLTKEYDPSYISFSLANSSCDGTAKINATVIKVYERKNVTFLLLKEDTIIKGVVFDRLINLEEKDSVIVEGVVKDYKGEKELIINKITKNNKK